MAAQQRIALIEDDPSIGASLRDALTTYGYRVDWYTTGATATAALEKQRPDLVLLDAGLPDADGFSICRRLRQQYASLPIILVTARDAEIDIVVGLDAGASDYVTKPFSFNVLLARVRAHLRSSTQDTNAPIQLGDVRVDPAAYTVAMAGQLVDLRPREFQLLSYLAQHAGKVVLRDTILADVWDLHWETSTKTLDMHIMALRRKFQDALQITAIRGVGYRLEAL